MAGIKTRKGQQTRHQRYYAKGHEWKPTLVVTRKRFSQGTREFMAAQSTSTGELYRNSHGLTAPWHSIAFTPTPEDHDEEN